MTDSAGPPSSGSTARVEAPPFPLYAPPKEPPLAREELRELLRRMLLIRSFEEKVAEMYLQGKVTGFCHLYIGQEAVAVGAISALRASDPVISHYREHGHCLAKGSEPRRVMAELFGKATGVSKGRGGSMHLFDLEKLFLGGYAIVAGQLPIAAGVAFAMKYQGSQQVTLCFFGDGALNEGAFHETMNLAALWKLPIVFLCENNAYGMGTSVERASAITEAYKRLDGYGIPAQPVDGMDVLAVREAVEAAVARARAGEGPSFLEVITYRFVGHSIMDPARYRSREELKEWQRRDPIESLKERMRNWNLLEDGEEEALGAEVREVVDEAVEFAEASEEPPPEESELFVYAD